MQGWAGGPVRPTGAFLWIPLRGGRASDEPSGVPPTPPLPAGQAGGSVGAAEPGSLPGTGGRPAQPGGPLQPRGDAAPTLQGQSRALLCEGAGCVCGSALRRVSHACPGLHTPTPAPTHPRNYMRQIDGKRGELEAYRRDMLRAGLEASAEPASGLEAKVEGISLI